MNEFAHTCVSCKHLTRGQVFFFAYLVVLGELDPLVRFDAGLAQPLSTFYAEAQRSCIVLTTRAHLHKYRHSTLKKKKTLLLNMKTPGASLASLHLNALWRFTEAKTFTMTWCSNVTRYI